MTRDTEDQRRRTPLGDMVGVWATMAIPYSLVKFGQKASLNRQAEHRLADWPPLAVWSIMDKCGYPVGGYPSGGCTWSVHTRLLYVRWCTRSTPLLTGCTRDTFTGSDGHGGGGMTGLTDRTVRPAEQF